MRIAIVTTQVPFVRGGAEMLSESLQTALVEAGHLAEIVTVPFKWYPGERILDHMLACSLMQIEESCGIRIDRMIGLKFPAYLMPHPDKVLWLLHQYRAAYDTWDSPVGDLINMPEGVAVREAIRAADTSHIRQCQSVFTLSATVSQRLQQFNGIASTPLHHPPPGAHRLRPGSCGDYVLVPSRIDESKRQHLVVEALALTRHPVRAVFVGAGNSPGYENALRRRCLESDLEGRVEWLGAVSEARKIELYSGALAVAFVPIDEDYGYVTLEAMLSAKPVLTCTDSGGPLEFITDGETGLVQLPEPALLAEALDRLWEDRDRAVRLGRAARADYQARGLDWSHVVTSLLA